MEAFGTSFVLAYGTATAGNAYKKYCDSHDGNPTTVFLVSGYSLIPAIFAALVASGLHELGVNMVFTAVSALLLGFGFHKITWNKTFDNFPNVVTGFQWLPVKLPVMPNDAKPCYFKD